MPIGANPKGADTGMVELLCWLRTTARVLTSVAKYGCARISKVGIHKLSRNDPVTEECLT